MLTFSENPNFYQESLELPDEAIFAGGPFDRSDMRLRRQVLRETVQHFKKNYETIQAQVLNNLKKWQSETAFGIEKMNSNAFVEIHSGDWGDVTAMLTRKFGSCFAVLNMANAYVPGGAYIEGAIAQEENMYRRTNCHFAVKKDQLVSTRRYNDILVDLISASNGSVYLDTENPRICVRGSEKRELENLGYEWLGPNEIFPFYELRSAAMDLRNGQPFNKEQSKKIIKAQFDTLVENNIQHVVLGAHGCGAFLNPAEKVAENYKEVIAEYKNSFRVIAFAIYHAGYGPNNFDAFQNCFQ
jgi:hypothetical protein